jgi:basic membrane protein A
MSVIRGKVRLAVGCIAIAATLTVAACGSSGDKGSKTTGTSSGTSSGSSEKVLKVGAALIGPKNDASFNQAAYEGIVQAVDTYPKQLKLTSVLENRATDQERSDAISTLGPIDDIVVGVSAAFGPVLDVQADKFPNTKFIDIVGYPQHFHKNVYAYVADRGAPAYVAGIIAAHLTKTNIVGFVGGAEIPPTIQSQAGFAAAIKSVNPKIKILNNVIGDFNDVSKAKAATQAMLADNADVIFPYLDAGIAGAYAAGKESGKNIPMFKLDIPDCTSYSNIIGTSVGNNKLAAFRIISDILKGTAKPGATFVDLQDPELQELRLCPKYKNDPKIAAVVKKATDAINSGELKLPADVVNARPSYSHREGFAP